MRLCKARGSSLENEGRGRQGDNKRPKTRCMKDSGTRRKLVQNDLPVMKEEVQTLKTEVEVPSANTGFRGLGNGVLGWFLGHWRPASKKNCFFWEERGETDQNERERAFKRKEEVPLPSPFLASCSLLLLPLCCCCAWYIFDETSTRHPLVDSTLTNHTLTC